MFLTRKHTTFDTMYKSKADAVRLKNDFNTFLDTIRKSKYMSLNYAHKECDVTINNLPLFIRYLTHHQLVYKDNNRCYHVKQGFYFTEEKVWEFINWRYQYANKGIMKYEKKIKDKNYLLGIIDKMPKQIIQINGENKRAILMEDLINNL